MTTNLEHLLEFLFTRNMPVRMEGGDVPDDVPSGRRRTAQFFFITLNQPEPHNVRPSFDFPTDMEAFLREHILHPLLDEIAYMAGQLEFGNKKMRLHWQFVIDFTRGRSKQEAAFELKELFGYHPHVEVRQRQNAAVKYVFKDEGIPGTEFVFGATIANPTAACAEMVVSATRRGGDAIRSLLNTNPAVLAGAGMYSLYKLSRTQFGSGVLHNTYKRRVVVFWGPTGLGKSRQFLYWWERVRHPTTEMQYYYEWGAGTTGGKWADGYAGQPIIWIDEFKGAVDIDLLKKLLDPFGRDNQMEVKGDYIHFQHWIIVITSNVDPEQWYPQAKAVDKLAIHRRLYEHDTAKVVHVSAPVRFPDIGYTEEQFARDCAVSPYNLKWHEGRIYTADSHYFTGNPDELCKRME